MSAQATSSRFVTAWHCPILVRECAGLSRTAEPVSVGIPVPMGKVRPNHECFLTVGASPVRCEGRVLSSWPDGSVRWLLLEFLADVAAGASLCYTLKVTDAGVSRSEQWAVDEGDRYLVSVGPMSLLSFKGWVGLPIPAGRADEWRSGGLKFVDESGSACEPRVVDTELRVFGPITCEVEQLAEIPGSGLRLRSAVRFYRSTGRVRWRLTLHNPNAAHHPRGLWDLGDPGSVMFRDLSVAVPTPIAASACWREDVRADWKGAGQSLSIYQESSGGQNYRSPNHRNRDGFVPIRHSGYRILRDGELLLEGDRLSPIVRIDGGGRALQAHLAGFWQNFPSAMRWSDDTLEIGLFPLEYPDLFELQAGESKTYDLELDFGGDASIGLLDQPLIATIALDRYEGIPPLPGTMGGSNSPLRDLVADGPEAFLAKREIIDEYGWRNFGDVLADHESDRTPGKVLVSHYNNQYDLLYGFGRQFIETGDPRWFELHRSLARHVYDIDIYKTTLDRPEYNGGLFWHTDHYVDAGLSTHRSFSREQPYGAYDGHARGGGPAAEHCYTRGLALHYLLTGDELSKEACLMLAHWMIRVHDGPSSILEWLTRVLRRDVKTLIGIMRGRRQPRYRYPLTRGTGNYLRSLLDAFVLTDDMQYLHKAETVIRETAHPAEVVGARELLADIESNWSYTVYLTSVGEYLDIKRSIGVIDEQFLYGRDALLHFAEWMLEHELPYLQRPQVLEFPNDTWTAQEIRKAVVLSYAFRYAGTRRQALLDKARWFCELAAAQLSESRELDYTRIRAILLQNFDVGWIYGRPIGEAAPYVDSCDRDPPPDHTVFSFCAAMALHLLKLLKSLKPSEELRWLKVKARQLKSRRHN